MQSNNTKNVLLITLSENSYGGVVSYNNGILKSNNVKYLQFRNSSGKYEGSFLKILSIIVDICRLTYVLLTNNLKIVHINPSLGFNSFLRDSIFVMVSKLFGKKVLVQWHGWNPSNVYLTKGIFLKWFKITFFKADHTKFLYDDLVFRYREMGYKNKITLGKTFVMPKKKSFELKRDNNIIRLLFLSTISKNKGIYKAIELFKNLKKLYPFIELKIAGKGPDYHKVHNIVKSLNDIEMLGYVDGNNKSDLFQSSDIYLFPSEHEGMPITVLEAMYFGLPIVTTKVGALNDFFEDGIMGYSSDFKNYVSGMQENLIKLINDKQLRTKMGKHNIKFVSENYMLQNVLNELEIDYKSL